MLPVQTLLQKIAEGARPSVEELVHLLNSSDETGDRIFAAARDITRKIHGDEIHLRGIIEFSNHCRNSCHYCGIRMGASGVKRYRMTPDEILEAAYIVRDSGCGTVVLQSGVDPAFRTGDIAKIVAAVKKETGMAVTLSIGTKTKQKLKLLKDAGADRFLLRFETCNEKIFNRIHPNEPLSARLEGLENLRCLNYQTGSGFMIGLPGATLEDIAEDILFTKKLHLDMIGCGPFIPAPDTPLSGESLLKNDAIYFRTMALIRMMNPDAHIPAATAFDSLRDGGRNEVLKCGANVFMPNFTPLQYKVNYNLYPGKSKVDTSVDIREDVRKRIESLGRKPGTGPGHALRIAEQSVPEAE
ncbi:MAG: [FeFe] hydrogenase H-cluster radical SAM maturase HydE [Kiritimatiellia bacterium]